MNEGSNKWSITSLGSGQIWIEFYDSTGTKVVTRSVFDEPAIREFYEALTEVVKEINA